MLTWLGRRTRLLGAFVTVAAGVATVSLSTLLYASGEPSVPQRLDGAAVLVQGPTVSSPADPIPRTRPWTARFAADLAGRLAAAPGVAAAVPDRSFYAQPIVRGRPQPDAVHGHGWSSGRLGGLRLVAGAAPRHDREVVLDRALGLAPGSPVTLLTATGPTPYTVSGVVDAPGCYVTDAVAAALAPGVPVIGLILQPGATAAGVAAAARDIVAADGRVLTGDARAALEPREDARTRWIGMQVLTAMTALAAFVSVFVVASTFAFNVAQRRRELGLLRAIGATPRQVRRLVYREALAVGASAALVGAALGAALAPPVGNLLVDVGFEPASFTVRFVAWPIAVSLALGPVVALLGSWWAARRAARVRPLEALREAAVDARAMGRVRWTIGTLLAAGGLALGAATVTAATASDAASFALYGAMALVVGAAVLAPGFVPVVVWLLAWPLRLGRTGMLVREGALTAVRRTASTAAPVLLTVSFAVLVSGLVQTSTAAYAAGRSVAINAGWVVAPDGTPGLSDAAVRSAPGAALLPTIVYGPDDEPFEAFGVDPSAFAGASDRLTVVTGSLAGLAGDTVAITQEFAERLHRRPDDALTVTFADGESVPLRVVAVVADPPVQTGVLLPRSTVRSHDPSALTSAIFVADPVTLTDDSGARVIGMASYAAQVDRAEDRLVWAFTMLLIAVSTGYGAVAVANTLLMATADRARDLRVLRRAGATPGQVAWTVAAESALVVTLGTLLGTAVAFAALLSIRAGLAEQVGAPVDLVVPWSTIGTVAAACLLLAVLASAVPARMSASRP